MFVGWKVRKCDDIPSDLQPPDYRCNGKPYWFFRHLIGRDIELEVVDNACIWRWWEKLERKLLHFYLWQALRMLPFLNKFDLIISHGAQSGFFLAFVRSLIGAKFPPHIIIDIGSLNGGRDNKKEIALIRFAMKSVRGIIYHVKRQELHYQKYFPEMLDKMWFVPFGPDLDLFSPIHLDSNEDFILSIGYAKRDWYTLISAYDGLRGPKPRLKILGDPKPISGMLPKGVTAVARVTFRDMIREISAAQFIVIPLPYILYAVGQMTVLQSMAMGKAVIVSKVPSVLDYITEGYDALFYTPAGIDYLREKMQYLIENPGTAKYIGANARMTIEGKFNESRMAQGIWNVIYGAITSSA